MANTAPSEPRLGIERIYIRDLSFESPQAPDVFALEWKPQVEIDIQTRSRALGDERFETVLTLTLEAHSKEDAVLVVELQQAGVFRIQGMDEAMQRRALSVTCPAVLFPYARETIDTLVTKGTFPPFMLAPINFEALFAEAEKRREAEPDAGSRLARPRRSSSTPSLRALRAAERETARSGGLAPRIACIPAGGPAMRWRC